MEKSIGRKDGKLNGIKADRLLTILAIFPCSSSGDRYLA